MTKHEKDRSEKVWSGKNGKKINVKDLSDSHLLHIIGANLSANGRKISETVVLLLLEAEYRHENKIFVPDYENSSETEALKSRVSILESENRLLSNKLYQAAREDSSPKAPTCQPKLKKNVFDLSDNVTGFNVK